jgi:hypothetical protein
MWTDKFDLSVLLSFDEVCAKNALKTGETEKKYGLFLILKICVASLSFVFLYEPHNTSDNTF